MMNSWYVYALTSLLLLGSQRFLYKVAMEKRCSTGWTTFSFMATVAALSTCLFFLKGSDISSPLSLFIISLINSGAFLLGTVMHMEALKYLPTHTVYTIIRLNMVVVVIAAILLFNDRLTSFQVIGICMALSAMLILGREGRSTETHRPKRQRGMVYAVIALFAGAAAAVSSKFAAIYTEPFAFIAISYFLGTLGALGVNRLIGEETVVGGFRHALPLGITMGILNFLGFYAFLSALSIGPLSVIAPIVSMHFVIAIVLSTLIYKEKISVSGLVGILLTVASIIMLRIS